MSFGALHVARTGLDAQGFRMQVIANNLANVNTTGFKRDRASFETLAYQMIRAPGANSSADDKYAIGLSLGTETMALEFAELPQFLQALLDLRGLNPNSMAKKAGNHALQSTVARFLGGNQSRRSTMQPVADFFGVDVAGPYVA